MILCTYWPAGIKAISPISARRIKFGLVWDCCLPILKTLGGWGFCFKAATMTCSLNVIFVCWDHVLSVAFSISSITMFLYLLRRAKCDVRLVLKAWHEAIVWKHSLPYSSMKSWPRPALIRLLSLQLIGCFTLARLTHSARTAHHKRIREA